MVALKVTEAVGLPCITRIVTPAFYSNAPKTLKSLEYARRTINFGSSKRFCTQADAAAGFITGKKLTSSGGSNELGS
jgi:hypothetical protein